MKGCGALPSYLSGGLAGEQMALVQRADNASRAYNIPMVVVLVDGKPTAEPGILSICTCLFINLALTPRCAQG